MQKILWGLLIFILSVFLFGLYKHSFNISGYIEFLSTDSYNNFLNKFNIYEPNTWGSFLYSDKQKNIVNNLDDSLDKKLEELNNYFLSGNDSGINELISGNFDILTGNLWSGGNSSGIKDNISGFNNNLIINTGNNIVNTGNIDSGNFDEDFSGFEDFFKNNSGNSINNDIYNNSLSGNNKIGFDDIDDFSGNNNVTGITKKSGFLLKDTGNNYKGLTPLLKKRLQQYKKFKQTLLSK